jgi:hypothetical protein
MPVRSLIHPLLVGFMLRRRRVRGVCRARRGRTAGRRGLKNNELPDQGWWPESPCADRRAFAGGQRSVVDSVRWRTPHRGAHGRWSQCRRALLLQLPRQRPASGDAPSPVAEVPGVEPGVHHEGRFSSASRSSGLKNSITPRNPLGPPRGTQRRRGARLWPRWPREGSSDPAARPRSTRNVPTPRSGPGGPRRA